MPNVDVKQLEVIARPVVEGLGYDLVDLEWKHESGSWILRLFIDDSLGGEPKKGVGLDDCARVSHAISAELDVADVIHARYSLEVSSPGLDRPLKRESDFRRFTGKKAKIRTRVPQGGEARRNFSGQLVGVDGGKVQIEVDGRVFAIAIEDVEKANLQVEI
jgi:ribosome maturation factor RimP